MTYQQWLSEDSNISWCQDAKGQWKKYINGIFENAYEFAHLVSTGEALILQENERKVILMTNTAYMNGEEYATGQFAVNERREGDTYDKWEGRTKSEDVEFCKMENDYVCREGPVRRPQYTFSQSRLVQDSESVVILYNQEGTPVVLTDTGASYNITGENPVQGKWIKSCNWSGKTVENGQRRTDFLKNSPTEWERCQISRRGETEIASYQPIQDIESVSGLIVMTPAPFTVVDDEHIYHEGTTIARGIWEEPKWNGTSLRSGATMSVTKQRNGCCEYKNGEQPTVKRKYVEVTQSGVTAIMHRDNKQLCILEEYYASIDGKKYAKGYWKHTPRSDTDEDNRDPIQFRPVQIGKEGNVKKYPNKGHRQDAIKAIDKLQLFHVLGDAQRTLLTEQTVRIDRQGTFTRDGVKFHNIQVQTNTQPKKDSITIAHVNVPDKARYIEDVRHALNESLNEQISYKLQ